jgi:protein disulfide-isomerase A1
VPVAKVDCIANQEICAEQEVQGYPTLKLFRSGEASSMEVPRKAEAIVSFLTKEMEPSVHLLPAGEVESFLETHPLTVVAYLENDQDERWEAFRSVANQKRHTLSFVAVTGAAQDGAEYQVPSVVLRRNFDEPKVTYTGDYSSPSIASWVSRNILPSLGEINGETFTGYVATELPIGYLFVDPSAAETTDFLKAVEAKLAPYKSDFVVGWINNNKYAQQAERLGLTGRLPSLAIDNPIEGARYVFPSDTEATAEALGEWFAQYKSGALKPHVKSEEIPESNDAPVKTVVAHTFKDIVYDSAKDVLVEFYAPWCGHCKKLVPIYDELGSLYSKVPSVVVAKIDATANDVPPKLNIRGFPTILLFKADQKDTPVEYQGARTLDDMAKFIHTHASQQFELPTEQPHQPHSVEHDEL